MVAILLLSSNGIIVRIQSFRTPDEERWFSGDVRGIGSVQLSLESDNHEARGASVGLLSLVLNHGFRRLDNASGRLCLRRREIGDRIGCS
jgi:hypothetical protein